MAPLTGVKADLLKAEAVRWPAGGRGHLLLWRIPGVGTYLEGRRVVRGREQLYLDDSGTRAQMLRRFGKLINSVN